MRTYEPVDELSDGKLCMPLQSECIRGRECKIVIARANEKRMEWKTDQRYRCTHARPLLRSSHIIKKTSTDLPQPPTPNNQQPEERGAGSGGGRGGTLPTSHHRSPSTNNTKLPLPFRTLHHILIKIIPIFTSTFVVCDDSDLVDDSHSFTSNFTKDASTSTV